MPKKTLPSDQAGSERPETLGFPGMSLLHLDSEQALILRDTADLLDKVLTHRAARRNPERIITDSLDLQRQKVRSIFQQIDNGPMAEWQQIGQTAQRRVLKLARDLLNQKNIEERPALYAALRASMIAARTHAPGKSLGADDE